MILTWKISHSLLILGIREFGGEDEFVSRVPSSTISQLIDMSMNRCTLNGTGLLLHIFRCSLAETMLFVRRVTLNADLSFYFWFFKWVSLDFISLWEGRKGMGMFCNPMLKGRKRKPVIFGSTYINNLQTIDHFTEKIQETCFNHTLFYPFSCQDKKGARIGKGDKHWLARHWAEYFQ